MDYTPEQRAIIARMSDLSTRYHAAVARQRDAQARAGQTMIDAVAALATAIERDEQVKTGQTMIDAVAALTAAMERTNDDDAFPGTRRRVSRVFGLAVRLELEVETADLAGPHLTPHPAKALARSSRNGAGENNGSDAGQALHSPARSRR